MKLNCALLVLLVSLDTNGIDAARVNTRIAQNNDAKINDYESVRDMVLPTVKSRSQRALKKSSKSSSSSDAVLCAEQLNLEELCGAGNVKLDFLWWGGGGGGGSSSSKGKGGKGSDSTADITDGSTGSSKGGSSNIEEVNVILKGTLSPSDGATTFSFSDDDASVGTSSSNGSSKGDTRVIESEANNGKGGKGGKGGSKNGSNNIVSESSTDPCTGEVTTDIFGGTDKGKGGKGDRRRNRVLRTRRNLGKGSSKSKGGKSIVGMDAVTIYELRLQYCTSTVNPDGISPAPSVAFNAEGTQEPQITPIAVPAVPVAVPVMIATTAPAAITTPIQAAPVMIATTAPASIAAPIQAAPVPAITAPTAAPVTEPPENVTPVECEPPEDLIPTSCGEAYVYCPGRSKCLLDPTFNDGVKINGTWGFNIFYDASLQANVDNCQIWMGVQGCDLSTGYQVGTATITKDIFHYCLDLDKYESNSFQLYAGQCQANDAGLQLTNGGKCEVTQIATYATNAQTFPMINTGGPTTSTFTFDRNDAMNTNNWPGYNLFPIGFDGRKYLVGRLNVCPYDQSSPKTGSPSSTKFVEEATTAPTMAPITIATGAPASKPTASPTKSPTGKPTFVPAKKPTVAPTKAPISKPTNLPSKAPTKKPSAVPTKKPSSVPTKEPASKPTKAPVFSPTSKPSLAPVSPPTPAPSNAPKSSHSSKPTEGPTTGSPISKPTTAPVTSSPSSSPIALAPKTSAPVMPVPTTSSPISAPTKAPTTLAPSSTLALAPKSSAPVMPKSASSAPIAAVPSTLSPVAPAPTTASPITLSPVVVVAPTTAAPIEVPLPVQISPSTATPTISGSDALITGCSSGFAYCPGRSKCISEVGGGAMSTGWSIEYNATDGVVDNCDIYIGVGPGCTMTSATRVGSFTITPKLVHYCLKYGHYTSKSYHFYTGVCPVNDNAMHIVKGGACSAADMESYGDEFTTFPLVTGVDQPYTDVFTFDGTNQASGAWTSSYKVFDIGTKYRTYLTGHVDVCDVNVSPTVAVFTQADTKAPVSLPDTVPPTTAPSTKPVVPETSVPVTVPTSLPPITSGPTVLPTFVKSLSPISAPTSSPISGTPVATTLKPATMGPVTFLPTSAPTGNPIIATPQPSEATVKIAPTIAPFVNTSKPTLVLQAQDCMTAYALCTGKANSTCFGELHQAEKLFGWSVLYNDSYGEVDTCALYVGKSEDGCGTSNSVMVGSVKITPNSVTYNLIPGLYESNSFHLYAGKCRANDNAESLSNGGFCNVQRICDFADVFETYPLVNEGGPMTTTFTFDASSPVTAPWPSNYTVFPLGVKYMQFLSAQATVCTVNGKFPPR